MSQYEFQPYHSTMKRTPSITLALCAMLIVCQPQFQALASDSVVVESKTIILGAGGAEVGVYISNSVPLAALVMPFEIRGTSYNSFLRDSLRILAQNRLVPWDTSTETFITKRFYAQRTYPPIYRPTFCPLDSTGRAWTSATSSVDFVSPDALLYSVVAPDSLPAGSDQGLAPSLLLRFGVGDEAGTFEIDTTCILPGNRLSFATFDLTAIVPFFQKSVITLAEPIDTISGILSSDVHLRGTIYLSGDLTIDSGVTVWVRRGTNFIALSDQDDQSAGLDTSRVEITVNGTLRIDSIPGNRPTFASSGNSAGDWRGIRVLAGGRFDTGIGAVIRDALIGVRLEKSLQYDTLSNLTLRNCDSVGISNAGLTISLIRDTVADMPGGIGIYVDSGGPLLEYCFLDSCATGVQFRKSWSQIRHTRVNGPGEYGIRIENNPMGPLESGNRGPKVPIKMADVGQPYDVSLSNDTVSGYFTQAQFWMGMNSNRASIHDCEFSHLSGAQRSPYGLYLGWFDTVTVRNTSVTGFSTIGVYAIKAKVNLGTTSPSSLGNNEIWADTTGCGGCLLRRITYTNTGSDSLRAEGNWWGANPPLTTWFSGKVDYDPYLTEPLGKLSPVPHDQLSSSVPRSHSIEQNYPNPFNSATVIEFALVSPGRVKIEVYNILGQVVHSLVDREFTEGTHRVIWDGRNKAGLDAASGVYLYRFEAGDVVETRKMVIVR